MADAQVGIYRMDINSSESLQLLARLAALHQKCRPGEQWRIEQEPHDYPDGTTHFTHVVSTSCSVNGESVKVVIGRYLTPELAELLVLMRNNLSDLVSWAQAAANAVEARSQGRNTSVIQGCYEHYLGAENHRLMHS